jgi:hypothetical protein
MRELPIAQEFRPPLVPSQIRREQGMKENRLDSEKKVFLKVLATLVGREVAFGQSLLQRVAPI